MPITPATSITATAQESQGANGELICLGDVYVGSPTSPVKQYNLRSPMNVGYYDDFLGPTIQAVPYTQFKGSDGACVFPAHVAGAINGTGRLTTGAGAGVSMAVNGSQLLMALNTKLVNGNTVLEFAVGNVAAAIANLVIFAGWSDQISALQMPGTISGTTFTAAGTDLAGFIYDTSATAQFWQTISTNNTTVKALTATTTAPPITNTFNRLRIETNTSGDISFYVDGVLINTILAGIRTSVGLTPTIAAFSRAATSKTVDFDYLYYNQARGY